MPKRILIGCYEVPGYGGASTVAYRLFEDLQCQGLFEVFFVNLVSQEIAPYLRAVYGATLGNPRTLTNVHTLVLERAPFYPSSAHASLAQLIDALAPEILVGVDFIATLLLKSSAPDKRIVFITAGCDHAKQALLEKRVHSVVELLVRIEKQNTSSKFHLPPRVASLREAQAVECADLILVHSEMNRALYQYYFPEYASKLYPEPFSLAEWICQDAAPYLAFRKPFAERSIDMLFIASNWSRPEKNWALARELVRRYPGLEIHIVGESAEPVGNAIYHGLLTDRAALFQLMGNARVVVSPSRLDAAPGILFEAVMMGCNVVASKNCGNWEICNPALLAEALWVREFGERIERARTQEYHHNLEAFLQPSARQILIEILDVLE